MSQLTLIIMFNAQLYTAIMCSALTVPSNGAIHFTTDMVAPYEFETEATYSCDLGYDVVQGNETRTCDGDGSTAVGRWSGQTPSCESKCILGDSCLLKKLYQRVLMNTFNTNNGLLTALSGLFFISTDAVYIDRFQPGIVISLTSQELSVHIKSHC